MGVIDIVIIAVFIGAIIVGLWKGVIAQLGSLGGIILGILACRMFGDYAAQLAGEVLPKMSESAQTVAYVNSIVGNVVLFLIVYLLAKLIARLMKQITNALCLGFVDRILGAVFALFKWFLVMSIIVNIVIVFFPEQNFVAKSTLGDGMAIKYIVDLAPNLFGSITAM